MDRLSTDITLLDQAEHLILYSTNNGIELKEEELLSIFLFKESIQNPLSKNYSFAKAKFLETLSILKKRTNINPENLIAISKKDEFRLFYFIPLKFINLSRVQRTLLNYKIGLITILVTVLSFQYFWYIGLSYFNSYNITRSAYDLGSRELRYIDSTKFLNRVTILSDSVNDISENKNDILVSLCKWEKFISYDPDSKKVMNFSGINCCEINCNIEKQENKIIRSVVFKLNLLCDYFLPLLYGLLGAIIFAIRNISKEAIEYRYNTNSNIRYNTQLFLGTFAGLIIGWVKNNISFETLEPVSQSLTPLVISFVAGYSIDSFFTAIDNYAAVITKKNNENQ